MKAAPKRKTKTVREALLLIGRLVNSIAASVPADLPVKFPKLRKPARLGRAA